MEQVIEFCRTTDGARVAYATVGTGPPLVLAPPWVSHLELDWETPPYRAFLEALARHRTVVRYDRFGCGLSDRDRIDFSVEPDIRSLQAVVDHLGLKRFALLGRSAGGPIAMTYAARSPARVSQLLLYGTCTHVPPDALRETIPGLIRAHWGIASRTITDLFNPKADAIFTPLFARYVCEAASAEVAAGLWTSHADVRPLLPTLVMPTVVIHRRGDLKTPFNWGRELAAAIPGARFVPLEGDAHLEWCGDPDQILRVIAEVLGHPFTSLEKQFADRPVLLPAALPDGLTPREVQVLSQVAGGLTNKEIATALGVTIPTIERHLVNVYAKIGARGRADAVAYALRHGLDAPVA